MPIYPRNDFTNDDDRLLVKYIAKYNPGKAGRTGNTLYQTLTEDANHKWSWSKRHTWQSWRSRYVKNSDLFDPKIARYQEKHNIDGSSKPRLIGLGNVQNVLDAMRRGAPLGEKEEEEDSSSEDSAAKRGVRQGKRKSSATVQRQNKARRIDRPRASEGTGGPNGVSSIKKEQSNEIGPTSGKSANLQEDVNMEATIHGVEGSGGAESEHRAKSESQPDPTLHFHDEDHDEMLQDEDAEELDELAEQLTQELDVEKDSNEDNEAGHHDTELPDILEPTSGRRGHDGFSIKRNVAALASDDVRYPDITDLLPPALNDDADPTPAAPGAFVLTNDDAEISVKNNTDPLFSQAPTGGFSSLLSQDLSLPSGSGPIPSERPPTPTYTNTLPAKKVINANRVAPPPNRPARTNTLEISSQPEPLSQTLSTISKPPKRKRKSSQLHDLQTSDIFNTPEPSVSSRRSGAPSPQRVVATREPPRLINGPFSSTFTDRHGRRLVSKNGRRLSGIFGSESEGEEEEDEETNADLNGAKPWPPPRRGLRDRVTNLGKSPEPKDLEPVDVRLEVPEKMSLAEIRLKEQPESKKSHISRLTSAARKTALPAGASAQTANPIATSSSATTTDFYASSRSMDHRGVLGRTGQTETQVDGQLSEEKSLGSPFKTPAIVNPRNPNVSKPAVPSYGMVTATDVFSAAPKRGLPGVSKTNPTDVVGGGLGVQPPTVGPSEPSRLISNSTLDQTSEQTSAPNLAASLRSRNNSHTSNDIISRSGRPAASSAKLSEQHLSDSRPSKRARTRRFSRIASATSTGDPFFAHAAEREKAKRMPDARGRRETFGGFNHGHGVPLIDLNSGAKISRTRSSRQSMPPLPNSILKPNTVLRQSMRANSFSHTRASSSSSSSFTTPTDRIIYELGLQAAIKRISDNHGLSEEVTRRVWDLTGDLQATDSVMRKMREGAEKAGNDSLEELGLMGEGVVRASSPAPPLPDADTQSRRAKGPESPAKKSRLRIRLSSPILGQVSDYSPPETSRAGKYSRLVKQGRKAEALRRERRRASAGGGSPLKLGDGDAAEDEGHQPEELRFEGNIADDDHISNLPHNLPDSVKKLRLWVQSEDSDDELEERPFDYSIAEEAHLSPPMDDTQDTSGLNEQNVNQLLLSAQAGDEPELEKIAQTIGTDSLRARTVHLFKSLLSDI